jgi:hypothetical protein
MMTGSTNKGRRWAAAVVFLVGCTGLGDMPSDPLPASRPRPQRTEAPPAPDLRIADNGTVAQASKDIPLVPVPPPPVGAAIRAAPTPPAPQAPAGAPSPASPPPPAQRTEQAPPPPPPASPAPPSSRSLPATQPDGTTQTPHTARQLLQQAAARCKSLDSYIVRLTRRENLKGKIGPKEIIAVSFRNEPFSVHFKWLGKVAEGREVVYVKGRFENKIHTRVAAGDAPLLPAGARLSLSPDNPLVRAASRHPITDAGVSHCVQALTEILDAQERGVRRQGTLVAIAPQRRPEYPQPVETLEHVIPPGFEPTLPRGGRRLFCFDPEWQLPMLVVTYDDKGNEVEYYRYDRMITPAHLDDDDFNPDKLWPAPANGRRQPAGATSSPAGSARPAG